MGVTQYIGARYVPIFADPAEWTNTRTYEPLTIVMHEGNSFTSKQFVPVGIDINNDVFWAETGNYNAQVEAYRQEVLRFGDDIVNKAFAFDTVTGMKEFGGLYKGAICHTNGFHASGDGGAAWYVISDILPEGMTNANEMNVIGVTNALYANLIVTENYLKPEIFGAFGDGVHDDSNYINHMFSYAKDGITFQLNASYRCEQNIEVPGYNSMIIRGSEINSCSLRFTGGAKFILNPNQRNINEVQLRDFSIMGNYEADIVATINNVTNLYLDRLNIWAADYNGYLLNIVNCGIIFCDRCIFAGSNGPAHAIHCNGIKISRMGNIFNISHANVWNMETFITFEGTAQSVNLKDSWIECVKCIALYSENNSNRRYTSLNIDSCAISIHDDANQNIDITDFKIVKANNQTNLFNSSFSVCNNTIYIPSNNSVPISNGLLEFINANSNIYVRFENNIFSGAFISQLNTVAVYIENSNELYIDYMTVINPDLPYGCNDQRKCTTKSTPRRKNFRHINISAIPPTDATSEEGNIYYDAGNCYFYDGASSLRTIPKKDNSHPVAYATADTIVAEFNTLISALVSANIINRRTS